MQEALRDSEAMRRQTRHQASQPPPKDPNPIIIALTIRAALARLPAGRGRGLIQHIDYYETTGNHYQKHGIYYEIAEK